MTCHRVDQLLCDYLDGALAPEERQAVDQHLEQCTACAEMLADAKMALEFVKDAPAVEPPIELIADIIHDTIGVRGTMPMLAPAGGSSEPGLKGWLRPFFNPLLQPRFAMSMVMAVLSLSMLSFYAKNAIDNLQSDESKPVAVITHVGEQFERVWDATTEFFETIEGMYRLQREFGRDNNPPAEQPPAIEPAPAAPQSAPPAEEQQGDPLNSPEPAQAAPARPQQGR